MKQQKPDDRLENIKSWAGADCERFRRPPVNIEKVDLDSILLKLWKGHQGRSVSVDEVIDTTPEYRDIKRQLSETLDYQRSVYLKHIRSEARIKEKEAEDKKRQETEEARARYESSVSEAKAKQAAAASFHESAALEYSAQAGRLDEARRKAGQLLHYIGGESRLSALMAINSAIVSDKPLVASDSRGVIRADFPAQPAISEVEELVKPIDEPPQPKLYPHATPVTALGTYRMEPARDLYEKRGELRLPTEGEGPEMRKYVQRKREQTLFGKIWRFLNIPLW